jgi:methyl-accepting chemotaxis protein-2 (aspartate sensor receptor)
MRLHQWISGRVGKGIALVVGLVLSGALIAVVSQAVAQTQGKIEATIFSYDGQDFVRTKTTLLTKDGKSAVNTKLEHDTPAYKALIKKHSYSGEATAFGQKYDANYAPLTSEDGKLTGALFVGVAK